MRFAIAVSNLFAPKVAVFVVDSPNALNACRGVLYDMIKSDATTIAELPDFEALNDLAQEYDITMSEPVPVDGTVLRLPDPNLIFSDDDLLPPDLSSILNDNFPT